MFHCRVCETSEGLIDLRHYAAEFKAVTGIKALPVPSFICSPCVEALEHAYDFQRKAVATDQKLREVKSEKPVEFFVKYETTSVAAPSFVEEKPVQPEVVVQVVKVKKKKKPQLSEEKPKEKQVRHFVTVKNCPYCFLSFEHVSKEAKHRHIDDHIKANGGVECFYCAKKFTTKNVLLAHLIKIHVRTEERIMECEECGKKFKSAFNYRDHMRINHQRGKLYPFVCPTCGKMFNRRNGLTHHITLVHEKVRKISCEECGKAFADSSRLKNHMVVHTGVKEFECSVCFKTFGTKGNLTTHEKTHSSQPEAYPCDICGKTFKSQNSANYHRALHFNNYPYSCEVCGQRFKQRSNLQSHKEVHAAEVLPCTMCTKTFKSKRTLRDHMKIHTGQTLDCPEPHCLEKFTKAFDLKEHVKVIHKGFRYTCSLCTRFYTKQNILNRHMRTSHPDELTLPVT